MKKRIAILLALCMLLSAAACATLEATPTDGAETAPIAEAYRLAGIGGGEGTYLEVVSRALGLGVNFYLILREDGTGCMQFLDAEIPLSRGEDSLTILPAGSFERELTLPCERGEGTLAIRTAAYAMDFVSLTGEELGSYESNGSGSTLDLVPALAKSLLGDTGADVLDTLLLALTVGSAGDDREPIPESDPSVGPVSGTVHEMEFTVLGADLVRDGEKGDVLVFYYDVLNATDEFRALWYESTEASQNGAFLESVFELDSVPELSITDLVFVPGKVLRAASAFRFDPESGMVGFRIRSSRHVGELLYYVDPAAPSGAPEPFGPDGSAGNPAEWESLPQETESVRIDGAERFKDPEGVDLIRFTFTYLNGAWEDYDLLLDANAFQDGIELPYVWENGDEVPDEGDEHKCAYTCRLRSDSPVAFVLHSNDRTDSCVAAMILTVD